MNVCARTKGVKLAVPASHRPVHRGFFAILAVPKGVPEASRKPSQRFAEKVRKSIVGSPKEASPRGPTGVPASQPVRSLMNVEIFKNKRIRANQAFGGWWSRKRANGSAKSARS